MALKTRTVCIALVTALLCSTAALSSTLPPITDAIDNPTRPGAIVWADLLTDDPAAAMAFYQAVFGWSVTKTDDPGYMLISSGNRAIGGIAEHRPRGAAGSETQWLVSMAVNDVDVAVRMVEQEGGKVFEGPDTAPDRGRMAIVADPQGAVLVLLRADGGDPVASTPRAGSWLWAEAWTKNVASTAAFYRTLAGYEVKVARDESGEDYVVMGRGNRALAGLVEIPWADVQPHWLSYIAVADIAMTIDLVEANGGAVLFGPDPQIDDGRTAIVADPTGGVFAIYDLGSEP
jgi:predicted enzyme related to lactoylglutathione lyase